MRRTIGCQRRQRDEVRSLEELADRWVELSHVPSLSDLLGLEGLDVARVDVGVEAGDRVAGIGELEDEQPVGSA